MSKSMNLFSKAACFSSKKDHFHSISDPKRDKILNYKYSQFKALQSKFILTSLQEEHSATKN